MTVSSNSYCNFVVTAVKVLPKVIAELLTFGEKHIIAQYLVYPRDYLPVVKQVFLEAG